MTARANEVKLFSQANKTVDLILVLQDHHQGLALVLAQAQALVQAQARIQIVQDQAQATDQDHLKPLK